MKRWPAFLAFLFCALVSGAQEGARGLVVVGEPQIDELPSAAGKRYAICVGVNGYEDPGIQDLDKAGNDAKALGKALKEYGKFDEVFVLTDEVDPRYDRMGLYPRLRNIRDKLTYLQDFLTPDDLVVFSFSGHGISDSRGRGYLVPADADYNDPHGTSLPVEELVSWIHGSGIRKSLLLIDACREEVSETVSRGLSDDRLKAARYENSEVSAVFYATKTGWYSFEDQASDYGIFTRFLLEGIRGKGDYQYGNSDGVVTFRELSAFVQDGVSGYALSLGLKQIPYIHYNGETFGDLAVSTYGGTIDVRTRGMRDESGQEEDFGSGFGTIRIYSNAGGTVVLDSEPAGDIAQGETVVLDHIAAGRHFVEIVHDYGTYRTEAVLYGGTTVDVNNTVILEEEDPVNLLGMNFLRVEGAGAAGSFLMAETEVTMGMFAAFVDETGYTPDGKWDSGYRPNYGYYPVSYVSKRDADAFARWFSDRTGVRAGLPTLEQISSAGGKNRGLPFPWGKTWNPEYCHNSSTSPFGMLPIVGARGPVQVMYFFRDITLDGITGLAGNVREWCSDESSSGGSTLGVIAGGSWQQNRARYFMAGFSTKKPVYHTAEDLGFRLVIMD